MLNNEDKRKNVIVYTDGACSGNGKVDACGGIGFLILMDERVIAGNKCYDSTTNNQMELLAIIRSLEIITGERNVVLYTDSKYVSDAINLGWIHGWRKHGWTRKGAELKNVQLWQRLYFLLNEKHFVSINWVKGHASNVYNNLCDRLARKAVEEKIYKENLRDIPMKDILKLQEKK